MIVVLFMRVVYPLKYPSNASLSCLDIGFCCWNAIYLECQNVIGVLPVSRCLTKMKYQSIANMPLSKGRNPYVMQCLHEPNDAVAQNPNHDD